MASAEAIEPASSTDLGMFGRLPTEVRLQIWLELLDDSRRFNTSVPNYNAILFVHPKFTREIYDLMYLTRTLNFTISAYDYTQASLRTQQQSLTQEYYFSGLDVIPCEDQQGNRLADFIPDLNGKYSIPPWLDCPFLLFKEIVIRIPAPQHLTTMIDAWEKICFLVDLFQESKHTLPNTRIIAVEGKGSESWSERDALIPKSSKYLHRFEDLGWLDILLQPFRQVEKKAPSFSYQIQDRGFHEGTLSTLEAYPSRELPCQELIDFWSLRFDLDLDHLDQSGNTARMLRFRRMLHWSGAYVKRTVHKLSQITSAEDGDEEDQAETESQRLRKEFEVDVVEGLVERSLVVRYSHPLTREYADTDIIRLEDHPEISVVIRAEERLDQMKEMPKGRVRNNALSLAYRFCGLPKRHNLPYLETFGPGRYLSKPLLRGKIIPLFYTSPEQFVKELSKVALSW